MARSVQREHLPAEPSSSSACRASRPRHPMSDLEIFIVDDDAACATGARSAAAGRRLSGPRVRIGAATCSTELPNSNPACLIIDVRMPDCNGLELFEALRSTRESIPVIFITGHGDIAMAVRAMKAGAVDFLAKPFDDKALLDAVAQATAKVKRLERRRAWRQALHRGPSIGDRTANPNTRSEGPDQFEQPADVRHLVEVAAQPIRWASFRDRDPRRRPS